MIWQTEVWDQMQTTVTPDGTLLRAGHCCSSDRDRGFAVTEEATEGRRARVVSAEEKANVHVLVVVVRALGVLSWAVGCLRV